MNEENFNPGDAKLRDLLRSSRPAPSLPPRFHEGVWRRIERPEAERFTGTLTWLDVVLGRLLRPRFALAVAVVLVLAGSLLGAREGALAARQHAQARYLAAVNPNAPH